MRRASLGSQLGMTRMSAARRAATPQPAGLPKTVSVFGQAELVRAKLARACSAEKGGETASSEIKRAANPLILLELAAQVMAGSTAIERPDGRGALARDPGVRPAALRVRATSGASESLRRNAWRWVIPARQEPRPAPGRGGAWRNGSRARRARPSTRDSDGGDRSFRRAGFGTTSRRNGSPTTRGCAGWL